MTLTADELAKNFGVKPKAAPKKKTSVGQQFLGGALKIARPIAVVADAATRPIKGGINTAVNTIGNSDWYAENTKYNGLSIGKRQQDAVKGGVKVGPLKFGGVYTAEEMKKHKFVSNKQSFGDVMKKGIGFDRITKQFGVIREAEKNGGAAKAAVYGLNLYGEIASDLTMKAKLGVGEKASEVSARKAVAKTALKDAVQAGDRAGIKAAKKVVKIAGTPVDNLGRKAVARKLAAVGEERAAEAVLKKGWQAASTESLAKAGLAGGLNVTGVGVRGGVVAEKVARGARAVSPARFAGDLVEGGRGTKAGEYLGAKFDKLGTTQIAGKEVGIGQQIEKQSGKLRRMQVQDAVQSARKTAQAATAQWEDGARSTLTKFGTGLKHPDLQAALEGDLHAAARVEASHPGLVQAVRGEYDKGFAALKDAAGGNLEAVPNYSRRVQTPEYRAWLDQNPKMAGHLDVNDAAAKVTSATQRRLKAGDAIDLAGTGNKVVLQDGSVAELNQIAQSELGFDLYKTDAAEGLASYGSQINRATEKRALNDRMIELGLGKQDLPSQAVMSAQAQRQAAIAKAADSKGIQDRWLQRAANGQSQIDGLDAAARQEYENAAKVSAHARGMQIPDVAPDVAAVRSTQDAVDQAAFQARTANPGAATTQKQALARQLAPAVRQRKMVQLQDLAAQARTQLETSVGAAKDVARRRAELLDESARYIQRAEQFAAQGDEIGAAVHEALAEASFWKTALKQDRSQAWKATKTFQAAKKADFDQMLAEGWKKHGFYDGTDMLVQQDVKQAMVRMEALKTKSPQWLLQQFDKSMSLWKTHQLMTPGFHIRNYMGGLFNNHLAGIEGEAYSLFSKNYARMEKGLPVPNADVERYLQEGVKGGVWGLKGQNIEQIAAGQGLVDGGKLNPLSKNFAPTVLNNKAGDAVENRLRGALYLDSRIKGMTHDEAFQRVIRYHYDGTFRSPFEQSVMGRMFPFFTYTRNNMPLQWEILASDPGKYMAFKHAQDAMAGEPDPNGAPPGDFNIRLPFDVAGNATYGRPDLQYRDLDFNGDNPLGYMLKQTNPFTQEGLERATGTKLSNGKAYADQPWLNQNVETAKRFIPPLKWLPAFGTEGKERQLEKIPSLVTGLGVDINAPKAKGKARGQLGKTKSSSTDAAMKEFFK